MASTQTFSEFNGSGGTETGSVTNVNWKNVDDATTAYSAAPVTAGANSYAKYQAIKFGGTYNSLSAGTVKVNTNAPATGITINGTVTNTYAQPATTATGDAAFSTTGATFQFGATPATATNASSSANPVYSGYVRSQAATTTAASPGDSPTVTFTYAWTES